MPKTIDKVTTFYDASTPEAYLRTRVDFKIEAYRSKGQMYRWCYLTSATLSCIAAAIVPVLINWKDMPPLYPTLLSLLVTILVGIEGIFHWRDHWKNYDLMKSFLREESYLYQAGAAAYRGKTPSAAFTLFVERIEHEIASERARTVQMRTAPVSPPQGDGPETR